MDEGSVLLEVAAALGSAVDNAVGGGGLKVSQAGEAINRRIPFAFKALNKKLSTLVRSGQVPGFVWGNETVTRVHSSTCEPPPPVNASGGVKPQTGAAPSSKKKHREPTTAAAAAANDAAAVGISATAAAAIVPVKVQAPPPLPQPPLRPPPPPPALEEAAALALRSWGLSDDNLAALEAAGISSLKALGRASDAELADCGLRKGPRLKIKAWQATSDA